jgi:hypothetical protein
LRVAARHLLRRARQLAQRPQLLQRDERHHPARQQQDAAHPEDAHGGPLALLVGEILERQRQVDVADDLPLRDERHQGMLLLPGGVLLPQLLRDEEGLGFFLFRVGGGEQRLVGLEDVDLLDALLAQLVLVGLDEALVGGLGVVELLHRQLHRLGQLGDVVAHLLEQLPLLVDEQAPQPADHGGGDEALQDEQDGRRGASRNSGRGASRNYRG